MVVVSGTSRGPLRWKKGPAELNRNSSVEEDGGGKKLDSEGIPELIMEDAITPNLTPTVMGLCQISESNSGTATSLGLNMDLVAQNAAKHGIDNCDLLTLRALAFGQHVENGTLFLSPSTPFALSANKAQLWPN